MTRGNLIKLVASFVVLAVVTAAAIIAAGFDVKQVPVNSSSVWVLQSGSAGNRYGQVNTDVAELASANSIFSPQQLIQSRSSVLVFTSAMTRFAQVDPASPIEFADEPALYTKAPADTKQVALAGSTLGFIANDGQLMYSTFDGTNFSEAAPVPLSQTQQQGQLTFSALSVLDGSASGQAGPQLPDTILGFTPKTGTVLKYTVGQSEPEVVGSVRGAVPADEFQIATIGGRWAVLDVTSGALWLEGQSDAGVSVRTELGSGFALEQSSSVNSEAVHVAGAGGLVSVSFGDSAVTQVAVATGTAARPAVFKGAVYGAWLGQGNAGGTLYSSATGETVPLDYNDLSLKGLPTPVLSVTDNAAVVNDTTSGWTWRLPDGALIPSSQKWDLVDRTPDKTNSNAEDTKVTTPKPPVAEPDSFGVRAGELVSLPVLLNDHDPNPGDILNIDAESFGRLDVAFGSVSIASRAQTAVVRVSPNASGSASFTYRVSDGTAADGLKSNTTTVSLQVVADDQNSAPVSCAEAVVGCVSTASDYEVAPGGTVSISALDGWVDPEGDRFFVKSASVDSQLGLVGFTESGEVVFQSRGSVAGGTSASIKVRLSDTRGATVDYTLVVLVKENPTLAIEPLTVTTTVGQPLTVDVVAHATGTSGEVVLRSANRQTTTAVAKVDKVSDRSFRVSGTVPESLVVGVALSDDGGEATGIVRINIVDEEQAKLATEPVTVLVSPGRDATVDLFAAAHNPGGRALVVSDVEIKAVKNASLFADPIKAGNLRVRGANKEGLPGVLGTVSYTLSDGSRNADFRTSGQAIVYQLAEPASVAPIGVPDSVTVRAGSQTDVDVLRNDVGVPGVPLAINATSLKPTCLPGGIIFSGGNKVRIVAPQKAGDFTCAYGMYSSGNPGQPGTALITIHVVADGANRKPVPLDLVGRVNAGLVVSIPVNLQNVDPDGDRVSLMSVSNPTNGLGYATINEERNAILFASTPGKSGQEEFTYTVQDSQGEIGTATVHVGVTDADYNPAPVTMTDYVEIVAQQGKKVVVNPLQNDIDPRGEALSLVKGSVTADAAPGTSIAEDAQARIANISGNAITFTATETPEILTYTYGVKNVSGSQSTGFIVVRISSVVSTYVPDITDTYVTLDQLDKLRTGIDVVSQKVSWSSGDINALTLAVERGDGFSVNGNSISGPQTDSGAIVVFSLTGEDFAGTQVKGYGLLHVPGINDLVLSLDPTKARQTVKENDRVSFDLAKFIALPEGRELEINGGEVDTLGVRARAKCSVESGTTLQYEAGAGAPWTDGCVIPVRIAGAQGTFSHVVVPLEVIPADPQPVLAKTQLTIVPDKRVQTDFDLTTMTTWYGHKDLSSLQYAYESSGKYFDLSLNGHILTITATGDAGGQSQTVVIRVTNHPDSEPGDLVLVVGPSSSDGPRGGTITKVCKSSDGTPSCVMTIEDLQGAYNDTPPDPLRFAPFGFSGGNPDYASGANVSSCGSVTLTVSPDGRSITTSWGKKPTSKRCSNIAYRVLDAAGRSGVGVLDFSIQGIAAAPERVTQIDFTESSILIEITGGDAALADPAVTEYVLVEAGHQDIECVREGNDLTSTCLISGLRSYDGTPGDIADLHTYKVYSKNEEGRSGDFATLKNAYAYKSPSPLTIDIFDSVTPIYVAGKTSPTTGVVHMRITPKRDDVVEKYIFTSANQKDVTRVLSSSAPFELDTVATPGMASTITATAVGRIKPPVNKPNSNESSATWRGRVAGSPTVDALNSSTSVSGSAWSATLTAEKLRRNYSGRGTQTVFLAWRIGTTNPQCVWTESTNSFSVASSPNVKSITINRPASDTQIEQAVEGIIGNLAADTGYQTKVCFTNGFGKIEVTGNKIGTITDPVDGELTYRVDSNPTASGVSAGRWKIVLDQNITGAKTVEFSSDGSRWYANIAQAATVFGADITLRARYCLASVACSPGNSRVDPSNPNQLWQLDVTGGFQTDSSGTRKTSGLCVPGENLYFGLSGQGLGGSTKNWRVVPAGVQMSQYFDGSAWQNLSSVFGRYRIPSGASVTKLRIYVQGNPDVDAVRGLSGSLAVEIPCS
jgi:hypothetical protein